MNTFSDILTLTNGAPVMTYEYVEELRQKDYKVPNANRIIVQKGAQEKFVGSDADITIAGGSRGGGKSAGLLLSPIYDIRNPHFNAIIMRNEKDDLTDLVRQSEIFYRPFGTYNKSIQDMSWHYRNGGQLKFSFYNGFFEDFRDRMQGRQYCYIGIDEITQMTYEKFKYLITCNRNTFHIRNRIVGTCNPDPESWVARFIDWWIGEDGFPIPERNGKKRYCFMDGNTTNQIYWGDTREEVYKKCRRIIDSLWKPAYDELGFDKKTMFIKSVTFIRADVSENIILLKSSPEYLANLAQQSEEQRARDLEGNWKYKACSSDLVKEEHMLTLFAMPRKPHGRRYVSCDVAFQGGDSLVMWLWDGWHLEDLFVCRLNAQATVETVRAKLLEWHVSEERLIYDVNGLGQVFKGFFPHAIPFNNCAGVEPQFKYIYRDLKSQCAYMLAHKIINGDISIEPTLLSRKYNGDGFSGMELSQILIRERKALRQDEDSNDRGWGLIRKQEMKRIVGHSPDYIEALLMRMVVEIHVTVNKRPIGLARYVQHN